MPCWKALDCIDLKENITVCPCCWREVDRDDIVEIDEDTQMCFDCFERIEADSICNSRANNGGVIACEE